MTLSSSVLDHMGLQDLSNCHWWPSPLVEMLEKDVVRWLQPTPIDSQFFFIQMALHPLLFERLVMIVS